MYITPTGKGAQHMCFILFSIEHFFSTMSSDSCFYTETLILPEHKLRLKNCCDSIKSGRQKNTLNARLLFMPQYKIKDGYKI